MARLACGCFVPPASGTVQFCAMHEAAERTHARLKAAESLLRSVEWAGPVDGEFKHPVAHSCPRCGKPKSVFATHTADCALAAFLREVR